MGLKEVLKDGKDPHNGQELLQTLKKKGGIRFYGQLLLTGSFLQHISLPQDFFLKFIYCKAN